MHVNVKGTLVKAATKRPKLDKDGMEVEGAALSITIDLPIVDLPTSSLAGILRAIDRRLEIELDDGQATFDVVEDRLEVTAGARR